MSTETKEEVERRFYRKVIKGKRDECWEWRTGKLGSLTVNGELWSSSRLSFFLATGIHPGKLFVCHECDNPPCVNPRHLWLGTAKDNTQDMMRKGRHFWGSKTHCIRGHSFRQYGRKIKNGHRVCCRCVYLHNLDSREKRRKLRIAQRTIRLSDYGTGYWGNVETGVAGKVHAIIQNKPLCGRKFRHPWVYHFCTSTPNYPNVKCGKCLEMFNGRGWRFKLRAALAMGKEK